MRSLLCRKESRARRRRSYLPLAPHLLTSPAAAARYTMGGLPVFFRAFDEAATAPNNAYSAPAPAAEGADGGGEAPAFAVAGAAVFRCAQPLTHVSSKVKSLRRFLRQHEASENGSAEQAKTGSEALPRFLVLVFTFRALMGAEHTAVVMVFRRDDAAVAALSSEAARAALASLAAGDARGLYARSHLREGGAAVRLALGALGWETAFRVGAKTDVGVHRGSGYVEVDMDVSGVMSAPARGIAAAASPFIVADVAFQLRFRTDGGGDRQQQGGDDERRRSGASALSGLSAFSGGGGAGGGRVAALPLAAVRWHYADLSEMAVLLDDKFRAAPGQRPAIMRGGAAAGVEADSEADSADGSGLGGSSGAANLPADDTPGDAWSLHSPHYDPRAGEHDTDAAGDMGGGDGRAVEVDLSARANSYCNADVGDFFVRGPGYLRGLDIVDKGLKVPSGRALYKIAGAHLFRSKASLLHVTEKLRSLREFVEPFHDAAGAALPGALPVFLIVTWNFRSAWSGDNTVVVHLFRRDDRVVRTARPGVLRATAAFINGTRKERVDRLKMIAKIRVANAPLRRTVLALNAERPVIIAKKLTTHFWDGPNYLEINQDVGSSTTASMLNSTVLKASTSMIMDTSWVVEAKHEDELPEQLLGAVRWNYVSFQEACVPLDKEYEVRDGSSTSLA